MEVPAADVDGAELAAEVVVVDVVEVVEAVVFIVAETETRTVSMASGTLDYIQCGYLSALTPDLTHILYYDQDVGLLGNEPHPTLTPDGSLARI